MCKLGRGRGASCPASQPLREPERSDECRPTAFLEGSLRSNDPSVLRQQTWPSWSTPLVLRFASREKGLEVPRYAELLITDKAPHNAAERRFGLIGSEYHDAQISAIVCRCQTAPLLDPLIDLVFDPTD